MNFKLTATTLVSVVIAAMLMIGCGGDAGNEPVTVTFNIAGMTCESCEEAIIHSVGQMDGVDMVESHHDPGTATVLYRPGEVTREAIVETIEGMGYKVVNSEG